MDWLWDVDGAASMLQSWGLWAVVVSLCLNVIISLLGVVPSVFLSGANAVVFGIIPGFFISLVGEGIGAAVSFWLYRQGLSKLKIVQQGNWKWLQRFNQAGRKRQGTLLLLARLTPFMPSGLITAAAACSQMRFWDYAIISLLGKAPTIGFETFIGHDLMYLEDNIVRLMITILLGVCFIVVLRRKMD